MDLTKTLTSPYVLMGGVAIGVLLLLTRGGGHSDVAPVDNNALYGYLAKLNSNSIAAESARLNVQARNAESFRSMMVSVLGADREKDVAIYEIDAGVKKAQIVAAVTRDLDIRGNDTRLELARIDANIERHGNNTAVKISRNNTRGAIAIAKIEGRAAVNAARLDYKTMSEQMDVSRQSNILEALTGFAGAFLPDVIG